MKYIYILFAFTLIISCSKKDDPANFQVTVNTAEGGTTDGVSKIHPSGTTLTIIATPAQGFVFDSWGGIESSESTLIFEVSATVDLTPKFISEEAVYVSVQDLTTNISIEGASEKQGTPPSGEQIAFNVSNKENLIAVVEQGFNLDLEVGEDVKGAYIEFKDADGNSSGSYLEIPKNYLESGKSNSTATNSRYSFSRKGSQVSKSEGDGSFNIDIDFNQEVKAGQICFNVYVYNDDGGSAPTEICLAINNYGGGPTELINKWQYTSYTNTDNAGIVEKTIRSTGAKLCDPIYCQREETVTGINFEKLFSASSCYECANQLDDYLAICYDAQNDSIGIQINGNANAWIDKKANILQEYSAQDFEGLLETMSAQYSPTLHCTLSSEDISMKVDGYDQTLITEALGSFCHRVGLANIELKSDGTYVDYFYIFELNEINDLSGDLMACIYNGGEISSENLIGIPKSYFSEFYPTVFSKVY